MADESDLTVPQRQHAPKGPIKVKDPTKTADPIKPKWQTRCTAKSKSTGERCARPPIAGATVCRVHGGAAPQVQFAAMERLKDLQPPAVSRLGHWIDQDEFPTVSLGACKDVLDRTMGRATEVVDVNINLQGLVELLDRWKLKNRALKNGTPDVV